MNGQFQIAIHILTLLDAAPDDLLSSEYIAGSININPALVRKEISNLRNFGLITSKEGKAGGYTLGLPAHKIFFSDVYKAIKHQPPLGQAKNMPNPACPVGRQINQHLNTLAQDVDNAIFNKLNTITLAAFSQKFK
ncbi:Rrf2 family transcriptional regulator [Mucilaginibacter sp. SP1R1]|uniref:Rrf2 family transcriptional regulator n=1 Tax=Mucilaginibacter sp. SP1R1 TaxID=2723091 RepID=UPI00161CADCE|nr:Rrf2 family transcriptional regulator [Mucilaginibacter sp. SP1R1]MBB6149727.1 Rrf2 family protein [Mucilaginibacter sp. SP1R1]